MVACQWGSACPWLQFKGRGHEGSDLRRLLEMYKRWQVGPALPCAALWLACAGLWLACGWAVAGLCWAGLACAGLSWQGKGSWGGLRQWEMGDQSLPRMYRCLSPNCMGALRLQVRPGSAAVAAPRPGSGPTQVPCRPEDSLCFKFILQNLSFEHPDYCFFTNPAAGPHLPARRV